MLSNSNIIYNANFREMIAFFETTGADVTLLYTRDPSMKRDEFGTYIATDENCNVTDIEVEPTHPTYDNTFMQVCLMRREFLKDLVDKAVAHGLHDLSRDLLLRLVHSYLLTRLSALLVFDHIPDAPHGLDHVDPVRLVDLAAHVAHIYVYHICLAEIVITAHLSEKRVAGKDDIPVL